MWIFYNQVRYIARKNIFPADLERSAGCQQPIFFLHITEQFFFPTHYRTTPPGIKWSAP